VGGEEVGVSVEGKGGVEERGEGGRGEALYGGGKEER